MRYGGCVSDVDHQRVAGWIALTVQREFALSRARYRVSDTGAVVLEWRGHPDAEDVSTMLVDAADPDMPVHPVADLSPMRADLVVGDVPVMLVARGPDHRTPPDPAGVRPGWSWLDPLRAHGAAADSVLWLLPPDAGGVGAATVLRIPVAVADHTHRNESTHVVVHTEHTPRDGLWHQVSDHASIRLRWVHPEWNAAETEAWLATAMPRQGPSVTAVMMGDRCVMRLSTGLRVEATADSPPSPPTPWSVLPSAVLSALCHTNAHREPPAVLRVRHFGHGDGRFRLTTAVYS